MPSYELSFIFGVYEFLMANYDVKGSICGKFSLALRFALLKIYFYVFLPSLPG